MKQRKRKTGRVMAALALPQDVILGLPRISMRGNTQLYLENHQGIVAYQRETVRVRTAWGMMAVEGKELQLGALGTQDLLIVGHIAGVRYEE
ncbi:MAG: sporulation protein YqfC [Clostridia bacterium]